MIEVRDLPPPEVLAREIVDDLEAAPAEFTAVAEALERAAGEPDPMTPRVVTPRVVTPRVRPATTADADTVADLLDAFNREFDTPTPGPQVLADRLRVQLAGDRLVALLVGDPAVGLAVVSLRPNPWYDGPVGMLDELYVAPPHRSRGRGTDLLRAAEQVVRDAGGSLLQIGVDGEDVDARRFYERHGYTCTEPGLAEPSYAYFRELDPGPAGS